MTTEYRVRLDRTACEGVFACLVRDGRFAEASDGLATVDGGRSVRDGDGGPSADGADELVVAFSDDRLADAEGAARACPVDAIDVVTGADDG